LHSRLITAKIVQKPDAYADLIGETLSPDFPMKPRSPTRPSHASAAATAADRRATPRVRVDRPVQFRLADNAEGAPIDAHLIDVSAGGVGLRVHSPLVPGDEFFLLLFDAIELASTPLRYRVVRCEALDDGQFLVGAAFVGNPRDAAVLTFAPRPEPTS